MSAHFENATELTSGHTFGHSTRDAAVRSVAGAVFPGMQNVQGQMLTTYKEKLRNHLLVDSCLTSSHCVACTKSEGAACFYSKPGKLSTTRLASAKAAGIALSILQVTLRRSSNDAINSTQMVPTK